MNSDINSIQNRLAEHAKSMFNESVLISQRLLYYLFCLSSALRGAAAGDFEDILPIYTTTKDFMGYGRPDAKLLLPLHPS